MATPEATTELNAVNTMLSAIGETPVNSLSGSVPVSVTNARNILAEVSRNVQVIGWHFNTDKDYPLSPDVDGYIAIPSNMIQVDLNEQLYKGRYDSIVRAGKLYDRLEHTNVWTETVKANVTWLFDFEELPEVAKQYITIRAARVFAARQITSVEVEQFTEKDEYKALVNLQDAEGEDGDYNIFNNDEVARTLIR